MRVCLIVSKHPDKHEKSVVHPAYHVDVLAKHEQQQTFKNVKLR